MMDGAKVVDAAANETGVDAAANETSVDANEGLIKFKWSIGPQLDWHSMMLQHTSEQAQSASGNDLVTGDSHNLGEPVSDSRQQNTRTPVAVPKETIPVIDETNVNPNEILKFETDDENDSSSSQFEDALEYLDDVDEDDDDDEKRPQYDDVFKNRENIPDDQSLSEDLSKGKESEQSENGEKTAAASISVSADDDTKDPQHILIRGQFYQHDDRTDFSTSSSEGSESEDKYDDSVKDSGDCRIRRRRTSDRKCKSDTAVDASETIDTTVENSKWSSKKVFAISKVGATVKKHSKNPKMDASEFTKKPGFNKCQYIDSLEKWKHDMYDEREQTPKSREEIIATYGYDIREEIIGPRAWRRLKHGQSTTPGKPSSKVKHGGMVQQNFVSNNRSKSNIYSAKYPALDCKKSSQSKTVENPSVVENSEKKHQQILPPLHEEEKHIKKADTSKTFAKYVNNPTNCNHYQDQQSSGLTSSSSKNKSYFKQPPADLQPDSGDCNKNKVPGNKDYFSPSTIIFNRKPPSKHNNGHNQHKNFKQQRYNNQGAKEYNQRNQNKSFSPQRRNFFQHNNGPQKYNHNRYFTRSAPLSSSSNPNQHQTSNHDQHHHTAIAPAPTADLSRTQHTGGHNQQCKNENQLIEQSAPPVIVSSKRYSVQRQLQQLQPSLHQIQQPQAMQIQQNIILQQPPPIQIQQYHSPLQQMHPHHGIVLEHNTGMMVISAGDPSMYQLYDTPPFATGLHQVQTPDETPPPSGAQSMQQQQPETLMVTYYQPQQ